MSQALKNILIIKPSALGDIVTALPALSAIRKSYPQAKISWLVRPGFAPLLQGHPYLDEIILFDRKFLARAWYDPAAMKALVGLIKKLRQSKFDAVIDLQGLFRTGALSWLSGSKRRIGPACAREFGHIFYNKKIEQTKDEIHVVDYYLKMVRTIGAQADKAEFVLPNDGAAEKSVTKLLEENGVDKNNYAVLIPGSAHSDKCWTVENFSQLAEKIHRQYVMNIVAIGTESEKAIVEKLKSIANVTIINLAGKTDIPELIELLKKAKLVVSNDTGPGQIATTLKVPLVMIFGRSNPARVGPYKRPDSFAAIDPYKRGFKPDSSDPAHSIINISIEQVFEKVQKQMESKKF